MVIGGAFLLEMPLNTTSHIRKSSFTSFIITFGKKTTTTSKANLAPCCCLAELDALSTLLFSGVKSKTLPPLNFHLSFGVQRSSSSVFFFSSTFRAVHSPSLFCFVYREQKWAVGPKD